MILQPICPQSIRVSLSLRQHSKLSLSFILYESLSHSLFVHRQGGRKRKTSSSSSSLYSVNEEEEFRAEVFSTSAATASASSSSSSSASTPRRLFRVTPHYGQSQQLGAPKGSSEAAPKSGVIVVALRRQKKSVKPQQCHRQNMVAQERRGSITRRNRY